jgi:3-oxoacyl-[acyl-carrier-protein] synthase-3
MSRHSIAGFRIAGIASCVPSRVENNLADDLGFDPGEVRKVVQMAGVRERRIVDAGVTASDLCFEAAESLLERLGWERDSISGLILVTQSPDYFLPSTSCMLHQWLGLPDSCAAFDVGLGCSGYPYGLYLAATMLRAGGHQRILMLHGETPSRFVAPDDQATRLLFSDAGSRRPPWRLATVSAGTSACTPTAAGTRPDHARRAFRDASRRIPRDLWLRMDGAGIFNFTIKRAAADQGLARAVGRTVDIDAFVFHQ